MRRLFLALGAMFGFLSAAFAAPLLVGHATTFWWSGPLFGGAPAVETSLIEYDGGAVLIYGCSPQDGLLTACVVPYTPAALANSLSQTSIIVPDSAERGGSRYCRFPSAFAGNRGVRYLACGENASGGNVYLYRNSGDPRAVADWSIANGGQPILTQTASGPRHIINNIGVVAIGDTWVMLAEGDGGLYLSTAPAIESVAGPISFDTNFNSAYVIHQGGSPELHLSPDGRFIYAVHAVSNDRFGDDSYVTFSVAPVNDLTHWKTFRDTFAVGELRKPSEPNSLIADPTMLDGWDGCKIIVSYKQTLGIRQLSTPTSCWQTVSALMGRR